MYTTLISLEEKCDKNQTDGINGAGRQYRDKASTPTPS